jgi:uncharacterized membrane protein
MPIDSHQRDTSVPTEQDAGQIGENIAAVHDFYAREELRRAASQRYAESISGFLGRPSFLLLIVLFVSVWIGANLAMPALGFSAIDPPPFSWLQGTVSLAALLMTAVILIKQNRVGRLSEQRAHLELKVMLIIEQKAAKLIDLMEELRRDLPDVKDRHDHTAIMMQQAMSPERVVAALDEKVTLVDGSTSADTSGMVD